jgi:hypothetical protein
VVPGSVWHLAQTSQCADTLVHHDHAGLSAHCHRRGSTLAAWGGLQAVRGASELRATIAARRESLRLRPGRPSGWWGFRRSAIQSQPQAAQLASFAHRLHQPDQLRQRRRSACGHDGPPPSRLSCDQPGLASNRCAIAHHPRCRPQSQTPPQPRRLRHGIVEQAAANGIAPPGSPRALEVAGDPGWAATNPGTACSSSQPPSTQRAHHGGTQSPGDDGCDAHERWEESAVCGPVPAAACAGDPRHRPPHRSSARSSSTLGGVGCGLRLLRRRRDPAASACGAGAAAGGHRDGRHAGLPRLCPCSACVRSAGSHDSGRSASPADRRALSSPCRQIAAIGVLRRVPCPFVCMMATLPPFAELEVKTLLHFTQCDTLRASSDRPNLEYRVQWLEAIKGIPCREKELVAEAVKICRQDIREWRSAPASRGICYVRQKVAGKLLAEALDCSFYHGGLSSATRVEMYTAWSQGTAGAYMVATAAFNAGVHHPSIRRVLHLDAPDGLVNYGQETGRAGRDDLPAVCLTLLPTRWNVSWEQGYSSDFLVCDRQHMTSFLHARTCLRQQLTAYLDGPPGTACHSASKEIATLCSVCSISKHSIPSSTQIAFTSSSPSHAPSIPNARARGTINVSHEVVQFARMQSRESSSNGEGPSEKTNYGSETASTTDEESSLCSVAARLACSQVMEEAQGFALYEERIIIWGRACILCSFEQCHLVEGPHSDCRQVAHRGELNRHRQGIEFKGFVGCYNCGHMEEICPRRGRTDGCMQPWLAWHVSWIACYLDVEVGPCMIMMLGGPNLEQGMTASLSWRYYQWLGQSHELFGHAVSNMGRLLYYWLDRLEERCTRSERVN